MNIGIRRFTRITFNHKVRLDFGDQQYEEQSICNLSLSGICVKGNFTRKKGDRCVVELHQSGEIGLSVEFQAKGVVAWVNLERIAIEFTEMEHESLIFLQTALLYQADDPMLLGTEFGRDVSFQVIDKDD